MNQKKLQTKGAWIGLYRKADDAFYWIDDTPVTGHFSAWQNGEPNDVQKKCVHVHSMWYSSLGKWNDAKCSLPDAEKIIAPVILCQKRLM